MSSLEQQAAIDCIDSTAPVSDPCSPSPNDLSFYPGSLPSYPAAACASDSDSAQDDGDCNGATKNISPPLHDPSSATVTHQDLYSNDLDYLPLGFTNMEAEDTLSLNTTAMGDYLLKDQAPEHHDDVEDEDDEGDDDEEEEEEEEEDDDEDDDHGDENGQDQDQDHTSPLDVDHAHQHDKEQKQDENTLLKVDHGHDHDHTPSLDVDSDQEVSEGPDMQDSQWSSAPTAEQELNTGVIPSDALRSGTADEDQSVAQLESSLMPPHTDLFVPTMPTTTNSDGMTEDATGGKRRPKRDPRLPRKVVFVDEVEPDCKGRRTSLQLETPSCSYEQHQEKLETVTHAQQQQPSSVFEQPCFDAMNSNVAYVTPPILFQQPGCTQVVNLLGQSSVDNVGFMPPLFNHYPLDHASISACAAPHGFQPIPPPLPPALEQKPVQQQLQNVDMMHNHNIFLPGGCGAGSGSGNNDALAQTLGTFTPFMAQPQLPQTFNLEDTEVEFSHDEEAASASKQRCAGVKRKHKKSGGGMKKSDADDIELATAEDDVYEEDSDDDSSRKKIKIGYINAKRNRQVTFLKRKNGVMKKAMELGVLTGCDVAIIVHNNDNGKTFEYSSQRMDRVLEKYGSYSGPLERRTTDNFYDLAGSKMIANLPVEEPELCQAALEAAASASKRPRTHHKFEANQQGEVMRVNGKRLSSGETAPMDPSMPGYRDGNGRTLSLNDSKCEEDVERPNRYMRVDVDGATDTANATMETADSVEDEADEQDDQKQHQQQQEPEPQQPIPILNPPPLEIGDLSDDIPAPWIVDDDDDTVLPLPDTSKFYAPPSDAQQQQHQQQLNEFMSLSVLDGGQDAYCKVMQPKVTLVPPELPPSVALNATGTQSEQTGAAEHHHHQQEQHQEQQQTQGTKEPDSNELTDDVSKEKAQETELPANGEGSFVPSTEARVSSASPLPDTPAEEKNEDEQPVTLDGAQEQPQREDGGNILETLMKMTSPLSGVETLSPPGDSGEDVSGVGGEMNEWAETLGLDDGNDVQDAMPMLEQGACKLDMDVDLDLDLGSDKLKETLEDSAVEDLFGAEDGLECLI